MSVLVLVENTLKNAVIGCQKMMVMAVTRVQPTRRRMLLRQRRGCRQFSLMEVRQVFNLRLSVVTSYLLSGMSGVRRELLEQ